MNLEDVNKIVDKIDKSSLSYFELELGDCHLKLDKSDTRSYGSTNVMTSEHHEAAAKREVNDVSEVKEEVASSKEEKKQEIDDENVAVVKAPIVGTFYDSPSPDSDSFVSVGSKVKAGDVVCIIESMKLMNEIEAEVSGEIVEVLVKNQSMVEYGQPLFKIRRA